MGHTNTGKTSLLRTLLRDMYFGEVKMRLPLPAMWKKAMINDSQTGQGFGGTVDTPGLEDASGLLDWLRQHPLPAVTV